MYKHIKTMRAVNNQEKKETELKNKIKKGTLFLEPKAQCETYNHTHIICTFK